VLNENAFHQSELAFQLITLTPRELVLSRAVPSGAARGSGDVTEDVKIASALFLVSQIHGTEVIRSRSGGRNIIGQKPLHQDGGRHLRGVFVNTVPQMKFALRSTRPAGMPDACGGNDLR